MNVDLTLREALSSAAGDAVAADWEDVVRRAERLRTRRRRRRVAAVFAAASVVLLAAPALGVEPLWRVISGVWVSERVLAEHDRIDVHDFVRDSQGRILAIGAAPPEGPSDAAVARYLPDGRLDESYADNGVARIDLGRHLQGQAALVQPDGKLLLMGCAPSFRGAGDCHDQLVLARLEADGRLDSRFGRGGVAVTAFAGRAVSPRALVEQPDGKLLVAGGIEHEDGPGPTAIFVARFSESGELDRSFAGNGLVVVPVGDFSLAEAVVVDARGRIVVGATASWIYGRSRERAGENAFVVVRFLADGTPDASFGESAIAQARMAFRKPFNSRLRTLYVQPDGRIVAAGSGRSERPSFAVARFTPEGHLDVGFGRAGRLFHQRPLDRWAVVHDLVPLEDGAFAAVGFATRGRSPIGARYHFVVLRLTGSGELDRVFGARGRAATDVDALALRAFRVGDELLVAGIDDDLDPRRIVLARFQLTRDREEGP